MADIEKAGTQSTAKTEKKPVSEKKKVPFGQKVGKFLRDYRSELKKVVWCTKKQTINNTLLVAVAIIISGTCIGILDFAFSTGLSALGKLL